MKNTAQFHADLTTQSFAYVAKKLAATSPAVQYAQILSAAETHRVALRLIQRDVLEAATQDARQQKLSASECQRLSAATVKMIAQAQRMISLIAAQYQVQPQRIAADSPVQAPTANVRFKHLIHSSFQLLTPATANKHCASA